MPFSNITDPSPQSQLKPPLDDYRERVQDQADLLAIIEQIDPIQKWETTA